MVILIGIGKSAHTREDTKDVIIDRIYADDTGSQGRQREHCGINTGHIERTAGLMLLGFKGEGIHVDTLVELVGGILVVLVRLDK